MKKKILSALVGVLVSGPAYAKSDHPTVGAVYNTKEASYISYNCDLKSPSTLECKFTYSSVRKKDKPEDWEKDLVKIEENFTGMREDWKKGDTTKVCAEMAKGLEIYSGKISLTKDKEKILSEVPEGQKADIRKMLNATKQLCQNFSKSRVIKFARFQHEKDIRTCRIYSSFDRQTFTKQGKNEWVSVQKDRGLCHSVIVERVVSQGWWKIGESA